MAATSVNGVGVFVQITARNVSHWVSVVEYWIVNLPNRQVEVSTQPSGPAATWGGTAVRSCRPCRG